MEASIRLLRMALSGSDAAEDAAAFRELQNQTPEIREKCEELARLREWSHIKAWEEAKETARICHLPSTEDGLEFALETARVESRQKE